MNKKTLFALALAAIALIGCTVTRQVENPPGSGNYVPQHVVDPRLTSALETAGAVNSATALVNPYSPVLEIGLGAAAAIATWFAKRKNDQSNQNAALLKTVIQGVENSGSSDVKTAIQTHAVNIGVEGQLGTFVAKVNSGQL